METGRERMEVAGNNGRRRKASRFKQARKRRTYRARGQGAVWAQYGAVVCEEDWRVRECGQRLLRESWNRVDIGHRKTDPALPSRAILRLGCVISVWGLSSQLLPFLSRPTLGQCYYYSTGAPELLRTKGSPRLSPYLHLSTVRSGPKAGLVLVESIPPSVRTILRDA